MILDMNKFNLFLCIRKKNGIGKKLYSLPIFYRKKNQNHNKSKKRLEISFESWN